MSETFFHHEKVPSMENSMECHREEQVGSQLTQTRGVRRRHWRKWIAMREEAQAASQAQPVQQRRAAQLRLQHEGL